MGGGDNPGGEDNPGGAGKVDVEVPPHENVPAVKLSTPESELKDTVLTEPEKQQVAAGTNIRIVLDVKDAENTVDSADRALVEEKLESDAAAKGFSKGQYLDISLVKIVGETSSAISKTDREITITVAVPEHLRNVDSARTRTFAVIRVHGGAAEILNDLDDSADTITIATDRFSSYTIVYRDTPDGGGEDNNGGDSNGEDNNGGDGSGEDSNGGDEDGDDDNGGDGSADPEKGTALQPGATSPKTGEDEPFAWYAGVGVTVALSCLLLYFVRRRRGIPL